MPRNNKKIADKIAERTINAYMMLKVPVGYSLVRNTKALLQHQLGQSLEDEDLEEVFSRFLDLVVFGLTRDSENIGSSMPDPNQFYEVAKEVLHSKEQENDDGSFDFSQFRFDNDEDEDEQPADPHGQSGQKPEQGAQGAEGKNKRY